MRPDGPYSQDHRGGVAPPAVYNDALYLGGCRDAAPAALFGACQLETAAFFHF